MEKYINPTERVANKLYEYITQTDEGKKKNKDMYYGKKKRKVQSNKKIFDKKQNNTSINNLELIDIKLAVRYEEDEYYLRDDDIFNYLRRGDSLTYNTQSKKYGIGRIGLIKFFDYKKKYNDNETLMENRVLGNVKSSKLPLIVYLTEKANGENFQVSYNNEFQCWIIGSKNVTLAAKDINDLEYYKKIPNNNRYEFTLLFAKLWFKILNENIKDKIEDFKKEIGNHTLIGEHVGDLSHQHIKIYNKNDVIFFGIVNNENYDNEICLPLKKSFEIFKKYNLSYVPIEPSSQYENFDKLKVYIDEKYDEVLLRDLEKGGEGCVIYISEVDENGNEKVLTLAKLKTFEYRFYRKLREKCKILRNKKPKPIDVIKKNLKQESEEIIEHLKDKIKFDDYINFGNFIIDYNKFDNKNYSNVFAEFISEMKIMYEKKEEFNNIKTAFNKKFDYYFGKDKEDEKIENKASIEKKENKNGKKKEKKGKNLKFEDDNNIEVNEEEEEEEEEEFLSQKRKNE